MLLLQKKIKILKKKNELIKSKTEVLEYLKAIKLYINSFIDFLKEALRKDKENGYGIQDDVKKFHIKYNGIFSDFYQNEEKKRDGQKSLRGSEWSD